MTIHGKVSIPLCAITAVLLAAFPAFAQTGGPQGGQPGMHQGGSKADARHPMHGGFMHILDTDGDGKVTMAEIAAEQKRLIGAADVDGDGKLSADEFRRRGRWFQRLHVMTLFDLVDVDGDGSLTADEFAAPSRRWLKRYDGNGDGALTSEEHPVRRWRGRGGMRGHGSRR